jgi:hypothetical protein
MGSDDATDPRLYGVIKQPGAYLAWSFRKGSGWEAVATGASPRQLARQWPRCVILPRGQVPARPGPRAPHAANLVGWQAGAGSSTPAPAESTAAGRV